MCGENVVRILTSVCKGGSPPRVRGKRIVLSAEKAASRITPACAGKTFYNGGDSREAEDHPRVCGENSPNFARRLHLQGSPPRVRGKLGLGTYTQKGKRITPACAGKT